MLNYNDIVNELNSYSPLELVKLYNSCSEKEYKVYSYNDMAIREFIEYVVRMELIDFIGMADTYSYDASRDNVFYKTDDDVIHVCGVKDIKVPFDEVINKAMTNKEFFKDIDFHFYIFLVEKDK